MATSLAGAVVRADTRRPRRLSLRRLLRAVLLVGIITVGCLLAFGWHVQAVTAAAIYPLADPALPHHHVALIFGAGLREDGGPSPVLYDRVATGVDLYRRHKVDKLLMSGDNGTSDYNEVAAMRRTAESLGVPGGDIVLDYAGFRTYDSCYRARAVFGLTSATLVTNGYHLPRALYTCSRLGVSVAGVAADRTPYATLPSELRELPALAQTGWWLLTGRLPHFLGPHVDVDAPPVP